MTPEQLSQALNWRYATKQFDPNKTVDSVTWQALEESLVLAPSSFGLQPWMFHIVTRQALQDELVPNAWNQQQLADCSHLVVFAAQKSVSEADLDRFLESTASTRGVDPESLAGYRGMMAGFVSNMAPDQMQAWTIRQTYIALGQFMTSAAALGVDTCPLEGISPDDFDRLLGIEGSNFATCVACAVGYRSEDDKYASLPKVRYPADEVIVRHD